MSSVLQILNQVLSPSVSSLLPVGPEDVHIQVGPMGQCDANPMAIHSFLGPQQLFLRKSFRYRIPKGKHIH